MSQYTKFFIKDRIRESSVPGERTKLEESYSDRSRIVFSSAFRRLQQKAQVFSLEKNTYVRSRMTHSIEVSDYGKGIATKIADKLLEERKLEQDEKNLFINIVENACYLHDIGNPPFGHFGESAIKNWFSTNWSEICEKALLKKEDKNLELLIKDFFEFDGNPQGFRIVTKLQGRPIKDVAAGLNLTFSQLYCFIKYIRSPKEDKGMGIMAKVGYFNSEQEVMDKVMVKIGHTKRYPLTYIMEAADDIAYCLSDIEDGLEKEILSEKSFMEELKIQWYNLSKADKLPYGLSFDNNYFHFKTTLARELIQAAADVYINEHSDILKGERDELLSLSSSPDAYNILEALKKVSRLLLFRSYEAEGKELAGYHIITNLLEKFRCVLELPNAKFQELLNGRLDPESCKKLPIEWRLFNLLPKGYVEVYETELEKERKKDCTEDELTNLEWFYRAHLIVDFISGMTDNYSLDVYRHLYGIEIR